MKKIVLLLCILLGLFGCAKGSGEPTASFSSTAQVEEETQVRAMWFSYVDFRDLLQNKTEEEFKEAVNTIVENGKTIGINRMYVHAVAFTDAFYSSSIYPSTLILPEIEYDPLSIFVETCHKNDVKIEAWINPMRSLTGEELSALDDSYLLKQWYNVNSEKLREVDGRYYLNPAYQEVRDLIRSVVKEIVTKYEVDGIHMDDYFYPPSTPKSFDSYVYNLTLEENPELELSTFRKNNVNEMVKEIYNTVKETNPNVLFGISPAGNMEYTVDSIYGDFYAWIEQGTVDYLVPQIYWGFLHNTKPFERTTDEWMQTVEGTNVKMIIGLAAYKIGTTDSWAGEEAAKEWNDTGDVLKREIEYVQAKQAQGYAYYNYESLFAPSVENKEIVEKEVINIKTTLNE